MTWATKLALSLLFFITPVMGEIQTGLFYLKTDLQNNVAFDTAVDATVRSRVECIARCAQNGKCNAVALYRGSYILCSLLLLENTGNVTSITSLENVDNVIWIRQSQLSEETTTNENPATTTTTTSTATATTTTTIETTTEGSVNCPDSFASTSQGCYRVQSAVDTWDGARDGCQNMQGGSLASPDTLDVCWFLFSFVFPIVAFLEP